MSAAVIGASVCFDEQGISPKADLQRLCAEEAENFVKEVLQRASILYRNSRAEMLTVSHVNTALEATGQRPLLGYEMQPSFFDSLIEGESYDVHFIRDTTESLNGAAATQLPPQPISMPYGMQWLLVDGVPPEKGAYGNDALRPSTVDASKRLYSTRQLVCDILTVSEQQDYVYIINALSDDATNQRFKALHILQTGERLERLLPYLLQFAIHELTTHFDDAAHVGVAIAVVLSLSQNEHVSVPLFAHSFLRFANSVLFAPSSPSLIANEDLELRQLAASIVAIVCERCESAFTGIRVSEYNVAIQYLFDASQPLQVHYGSICVLKYIGGGALKKVAPHISAYLRIIECVKGPYAAAIREISRDIV